MKRDMDLIRELLLRLEALPLPSFGFRLIQPDEPVVQVEGYSIEEIDYHLSLLDEARLIHAGGLDEFGTQAGSGVAFRSLTWAGHDFLESVRTPDVWERAKKAASAAGGVTVELLVFAARTYLENSIKGLVSG